MGYVFSLPKNYLDPRRSFTVTQEMREEGLVPYMPEIPVSPQAFINYNKTGIYSSNFWFNRKILSAKKLPVSTGAPDNKYKNQRPGQNRVHVSFSVVFPVTNIEGIHSVGAGLESTSLVFTHGLDLFYTRVTPSRMFDVLKDDFDYWFVAATLGLLVIVTFLSQRLAAVKMLKQMWQ